MTYLRVTTIPGRFTEVLDPQVTATGRAVLNRLRSGGQRPGWPGSDYARYRCPPPSDRSPTQDPPARPGASQEDTAGSPGYNLWITRQIVHRQPAPLYTRITALSTVLQKSRKARKMFSSTMLAIFDSRPPSSRKEGRHQGQVHWLVCTQSPGLAHPSASHLRYQLTEIPDPIGDYCLHTQQTVQALSCVGKVPLGAKRKGGICSSGKTLPARKVQGSGVRCQVVVSAEENHSCPVYWAAPGGPGSRAKARDCFCLPCFMCLWRQATDSIRLQDGPCLVAISYSPFPPPSPMSSSPPRRPLWSYTGTPQLPIGESGSVRSETPDQKKEA